MGTIYPVQPTGKIVHPVLPAAADEGCRLSVLEWLKAVQQGITPARLAKLYHGAYPELKALMCAKDALGLLVPDETRRPSPTEPALIAKRSVLVPPAEARTDVDPIPGEIEIMGFCAPRDAVLVIEHVEVVPANLTAWRHGYVEYKTVFDNWKHLCPKLQGQRDCPGTYNVLENLLLAPGAGFKVMGVNLSTCSRARLIVEYRSWLAR